MLTFDFRLLEINNKFNCTRNAEPDGKAFLRLRIATRSRKDDEVRGDKFCMAIYRYLESFSPSRIAAKSVIFSFLPRVPSIWL